MGIKNLKKMIRKAGLVREVDPSVFAGKTIMSDTSIWTYASVAKNLNYIGYFMRQHQKISRYGIKLVYVFDGPPKKDKSATLEDRAKKAENSSAKKPTYDHFNVLKSIFEANGVEWMQAKHETDPLCAELFHSGRIAAAITRDTDFLAYGIDTIIENFSAGKFSVIYLSEVLNHFKLTFDQFVHYCILLGTDYNPNIPKIAEVGALKAIQKYNSIENFVLTEKITPPFDPPKIIKKFTKRKTVEERIGEKKTENISSPEFLERLKKTLLTTFPAEKIDVQIKYALSFSQNTIVEEPAPESPKYRFGDNL
jgi:5'-3' exonuclease